ncbi:PIN domain-containing protein [Candidatus Bathyarchaeota archaeon]|nr:PIN domain-containing protein [Candidatus Bathyarchaeota archaeon]
MDAYAWIEIFIGSENGKKAKEVIQNSEEAYTPNTVLAEVARKYLREGVKEQTILERLITIEEASEIFHIDKNIAIESAKCYIKLIEKAKKEKLETPSLFDAIVLATARMLNAKIITGDEHLKEENTTIWIGKT